MKLVFKKVIGLREKKHEISIELKVYSRWGEPDFEKFEELLAIECGKLNKKFPGHWSFKIVPSMGMVYFYQESLDVKGQVTHKIPYTVGGFTLVGGNDE